MQLFQGNNLPRVKISNQSAILRMIYYCGPIQRAQIAERLGLTLPTITTNINSMLADGIVKEVDAAGMMLNSNGRRAHLLEINAEAYYFAGIELRGDKWSVCITDFCGQILASNSEVMEDQNYDLFMQQVSRCFMECLEKIGKQLKDITGIGIGLPGMVDRENGILKVMSRFQWMNKHVREDFARLTGYQGRITLENNAVARGLSVQVFHWDEVKNVKTFAYLFMAVGVACPLFLNTSGYRGSVVGAGEVGHMVVEPRGRACTCGNRGCLEAYAGEQAIINDCMKEMEQGRAGILQKICADKSVPKFSEILKAQEMGDEDVRRIIEEAVYMLAIAAANIIHFTGPDIMLVDSKLFENEYNRRLLRNRVKENLCGSSCPEERISFITPGKYMRAQGAVSVAIDERLELSV